MIYDPEHTGRRYVSSVGASVEDHAGAVRALRAQYQALPRTAEGLQISPWLYRIATNTALDALRRRKRITWVPFKVDNEPQVSDTAARHAESDAIQHALEQVPPDQRTCLVLNMSQGMSYKEIADTLGISVNLVAVRIFRGREKFVSAYKKANSEG